MLSECSDLSPQLRCLLMRVEFVDEQIHDDDGCDREQGWMVLDGINLENDEPIVQQVKLLV